MKQLEPCPKLEGEMNIAEYHAYVLRHTEILYTKIKGYVEAVDKEKDRLRARIAELEKERDEILKEGRQIVCTYCGYKVSRDEDGFSEKITDHILSCSKNPVLQIATEVGRKADSTLEEIRKGWPAKCPITGLDFWGGLTHPDLGEVPTYGGPHDTYTIPERDQDGDFIRYRYDHDEGSWVEGVEVIGVKVVSEESLLKAEEERDQLRAELEEARKAHLGDVIFGDTRNTKT